MMRWVSGDVRGGAHVVFLVVFLVSLLDLALVGWGEGSLADIFEKFSFGCAYCAAA